jgi:hypothetical protein
MSNGGLVWAASEGVASNNTSSKGRNMPRILAALARRQAEELPPRPCRTRQRHRPTRLPQARTDR